MALTLDQEAALLTLLDEKRITLPELTATAEIRSDDLMLTNQLLADKSITAKVLKDYIAPPATLDEQGIVQLSNAIDSEQESIAATSKAINRLRKHLFELTYPIGSVIFFAQNRDPNELFPGTQWAYIGENKTIRLGSKSGSDVMETGGNDSIKLSASQLPSHNHTFDVTSQSFDHGTKSTNTTDRKSVV